MGSGAATKLQRVAALGHKELRVNARLHGDARAALHRMELRSPALREARSRAYAYAVFPSVGQGGAVLGGVWGMGELFRRDRLVGYAALVQLTLGVQLGGQTVSEIVLFEDRASLERFKKAGVGLTIGAAATIIKAGAAVTSRPPGSSQVYVATSGGLWAGGAIGLQRIFSFPAVFARSVALRAVLSALPSHNDSRSASEATGQTEDTMAKALRGKMEKHGLKRLVPPWGRKEVEEKGRVRQAVGHVGARGRHAVEAVRERLPRAEELREGAEKARTWTAGMIGEHAVALGLSTLAMGVAGAAMLPVSERERRVLSAASKKVKKAGKALRESEPMARMTHSIELLAGRIEEGADQVETAARATKTVAKKAATTRTTARKAAARKTASASRSAKGHAPASKKSATAKKAASASRSAKGHAAASRTKTAAKKTSSPSRSAKGHAPASRKSATAKKTASASRSAKGHAAARRTKTAAKKTASASRSAKGRATASKKSTASRAKAGARSKGAASKSRARAQG